MDLRSWLDVNWAAGVLIDRHGYDAAALFALALGLAAAAVLLVIPKRSPDLLGVPS